LIKRGSLKKKNDLRPPSGELGLRETPTGERGRADVLGLCPNCQEQKKNEMDNWTAGGERGTGAMTAAS